MNGADLNLEFKTMKWPCAKGAQTEMNKNANFVETESRFFTERINLVHEIELIIGKHKQMLPYLRAIASRSTQMKNSFLSLPFFLFELFSYSYNRGWGIFYPQTKKSSFLNQILYRWKLNTK